MRHLISLLFFATVIQAQETSVQLHSGSKLSGVLSIKEIPFQTKYGILNIPISEIKRIHLGLHYYDGEEEKANQAFKRLGSPIHKEREIAQRELISFGKYAFPVLKSTDSELSGRIKIIKEKILEADLTADKFTDYDVLRLEDYEIRGKLLLKEVEISHKDFGKITVKVAAISALRDIFKLSKTHTIQADGDWHCVGYVSRGDSAILRANGQVDLWPQAPNTHLATPRGSNTSHNGFSAGSLLGKIGESEFFVGEYHDLQKGQEGKLYLKINPNPWSQPSSGEYKVQIKGD